MWYKINKRVSVWSFVLWTTGNLDVDQNSFHKVWCLKSLPVALSNQVCVCVCVSVLGRVKVGCLFVEVHLINSNEMKPCLVRILSSWYCPLSLPFCHFLCC